MEERCSAEGQTLVCAQPRVLKVRRKDYPRNHKTVVDHYSSPFRQPCPWFHRSFPFKLLETALGESKLLWLQPTSPRGLQRKFPLTSQSECTRLAAQPVLVFINSPALRLSVLLHFTLLAKELATGIVLW